jgi:hypothetical protein
MGGVYQLISWYPPDGGLHQAYFFFFTVFLTTFLTAFFFAGM